MIRAEREIARKYHLDFRVFVELMANRVREILLVASRYEAFILEEDVTLASRIISEYSGLNLSLPPRVTRCFSAEQALRLIRERPFDLVIAMPNLEDMDASSLGVLIKERRPSLPVYLLAHSLRGLEKVTECFKIPGIDKIFIWSGNADLVLAIIKSTEDALNVEYDTTHAQVCVLIFVEDSPEYYSRLLPIFYKEVVRQIQAVLELGVNEEERLLIMRTRPKILWAQSFDEAFSLYGKYKDNLLGIISDSRIPRNGRLCQDAGCDLLALAKEENPHLPLLLFSSEPHYRTRAERMHTEFIDKNSPFLKDEIHAFFLNHLGFGDFVFRIPDGKEVARARKLRELEECLRGVPEESLRHHIARKDMATWVMMRSEIPLARTIRDISESMFPSTQAMREHIVSLVHIVRKWRQKGVVTKFNRNEFSVDLLEFAKIGDGSLGGKARSIAFMSFLLQDNLDIHDRYPQCTIGIPQTVVLATDIFEEFVEKNHLGRYALEGHTDEEIARAFLDAELPERVVDDLREYLVQVGYPLSVRSSSLLEDAQFHPYAGVYRTYMVPNNQQDLASRLSSLLRAVKLVYASTYFESPKSFAKSTGSRVTDEAMGVVIQQLVGLRYSDFYYPCMSGVAQSFNYYPVDPMKPEDGVVHMAVGFGKTVVEGGKSLRFCPRYPEVLTQFSTVDDILANSQRFFYALRLGDAGAHQATDINSFMERRDIYDAREEFPIVASCSTYDPAEHRIIDTGAGAGGKVVTFARILKHKVLPLPELLSEILDTMRRSMGCPVEIEFAVNLREEDESSCDFYLLQMRPMVTGKSSSEVTITSGDLARSFCSSRVVLGNGVFGEISDIVYVKLEDFSLEDTPDIAEEVGRINGLLVSERRPYLLIGPGRWGSFDRWLGIPVQWRHISGVGAIVEIRGALIKADPSLGSHFFHNITSLGIPYFTVTETGDDKIDWGWLSSLTSVHETRHLRHVRTPSPITIKIDGRSSHGVILMPAAHQAEDGPDSRPCGETS